MRNGLFAVLVRHCFALFFDRESMSPQAESQSGLAQVLGYLAVPTAFFTLFFRPFGMTGWSHVSMRYFFLCYSMAVIAFVVVLKWDALFPDRRDYQILTPLPLRLGVLFAAKVVALAAFVGFFLVVLNFFGAFFWPGIDGKPDMMFSLGTHIVVVLVSGLFAGIAAAAIQGVLITLFSGTLLRRVAIVVQTLLLAVLVMLLVLIPVMGPALRDLTRNNSVLLKCVPVYWFVGWYEQLRPATRNAALIGIGDWALPGLVIATAVFLLTYLPGYRRHARKVMDAPVSNPAGPSRAALVYRALLHRWVIREPAERAVFHFIGQTIARSMKHRVFLAGYGGLGAALAVISYLLGEDGLLQLPLTLSFILVSGLRAAFNVPSELKANWGFQITDTASVRHYTRGTRRWILFCAVAPVFVLYSPVEFASYAAGPAMFHIAWGVALSAVLIEVMFFGFRKVPFTCAYFPGKVNLAGLSVLYVFGFTFYSRWMASVESALLQMSVGVMAAALAGLLVVRSVIARAADRYTDEAGSLDYEDRDPAVQTLDLGTAGEFAHARDQITY